MSRVDQALTTWEARRVAPADPAVPSESQRKPAALHEYSDERVNGVPSALPAADNRPPAPPSLEPEIPAAARRPPVEKSPKAREREARLVTDPSNGVSIEQYRRLAATLDELQVDKQLNSVMITSAVPQEGKTLTVVNLGLTLSQSYGRRVLLIDADLRSPSLHLTLGIANGSGLCDALRDPLRELPVVKVSDRLNVVTAGLPEGMPLAALSSPRMREIVDRCQARFDWVLIDTSPIGILPDASVVARLVGGVVFVIRAGATPSHLVERAIGELEPEAIIGLVLNRVEERRIGAAGYYQKYEAAHARR